MSLFLFVTYLFLNNVNVRANERPECDSFYNYICRNDENSSKSANVSYFEILGTKNEEIVHEIVTNGALEHAYEACLSEFWKPSAFLESLTHYPETKRSQKDRRSSSTYRSFKTLLALKEQNVGSTFPMIVSMTKKLNEDKFCLDISPNVEWIKFAKIASAYIHEKFSNEEGIVLQELNRAEFFVSYFIDPLLNLYDKTTEALSAKTAEESSKERRGEDSNWYLKSYLKRYRTLNGSVREGGIDSFLEDALMTAYDIKSEKFCIHTNGYDEFFVWLSQHLDLSFLQLVARNDSHEFPLDIDSERDYLTGLDVVDVLVDFSNDLIFERLSQKKPKMQIKERKCKTLLSTMFTGMINTRYLGSFVSREDMNLQRDVLGESVMAMIEKLKRTMKNLIANSAHLPLDFKQFATKKLENMRTYVLTKQANLHHLHFLEKNASACLSDFNRNTRGISKSTWYDLVTCAAMYKSELEKKSFKEFKAGPSETGDSDYETRYAYLYETTDTSIVNAWYDPTRNEITVPSGIVLPPIYVGNVRGESDMFDLSKMGMILGHELGHSLDVNGLCWDQDGNFDITEAFCAKRNQPRLVKSNVHCLEQDYGHPCNGNDNYGENTIGEDIADQLGLITAYNLFLEEYDSQLRLEDKRDFFRKYAMLWCDGKHPLLTYSTETSSSFLSFKHYGLSLIRRNGENKSRAMGSREKTEYVSWVCDKVKNDVHALPQHRVNKTLRQIQDFASLFQCQAEDGMVKEKKCLIY